MISKDGEPLEDLETWFRLAGPKHDNQWQDGRSAKEAFGIFGGEQQLYIFLATIH